MNFVFSIQFESIKELFCFPTCDLKKHFHITNIPGDSDPVLTKLLSTHFCFVHHETCDVGYNTVRGMTVEKIHAFNRAVSHLLKNKC